MIDHSSSKVMHVTNIFHFKDKRTVFVGKFAPNVDLSFPLRVSVLIDGKSCQSIILQGYRMPGDHLPEVVYTDDSVNLDTETVQGGRCLLVIGDNVA